MALDFSNRNPQDPNGIYSIDTSGAQPAWVNDDWTVGPISDQAEARKAGATNQVRVVVAITNDGKKYNVVLGADGKPMSQIGDVIGQDDDVSRRWQQNGPKAQPPGASPTQNRNGRIYGYNPQTGQYDIDQGPAPQTGTRPPIPAGGSSVTEGTPIEFGPDGKPTKWDNQRPRQVIRDANGNVVWSEELTGADLTAWRNQQQASQPQTKREPDKEHPGLTIVTTVQGGQTETHYEDANGNRVATPGKEPSVQLVTINGQPGYQVRTTPGANGQPPKVEWFDPSGKPLAQPPVQAGQPHTENVTINGQRYTTVTTANPDGTISIKNYDPAGKEIPQLPTQPSKDGFAGEPAGAPEMPTQPGQVMAGLQTYSAWLNSQVKLWKDSGGKQGVSPDDATKLMDRRLAMAKGTADEQSGLVTAQTNLRGQDITQRGQTLTDTQGRRAAAQTAYKNVLDLLPLASKLGPGGAPALAALMAGLLPNQRDYIGSYGGFRESPEVGTPGVLDQVRQAAMTGINNAAQGGPTIFQSRPVDGAPAVTANAAAAPPDPAGHAANIMANPVFRPRPVAPAPAPALPPGPTPPLGQGQDLSTPPPVPVNPLPGQPGHDPSKPVGMTPPPTVPVATNPIDNSPVAPPPGSVASLLMSGAQGMAGAAPMPSQSQLAALLGRGSQGARQEPDVYDGFPQNMPASPWLQQMQQGAAWDSNTHGAAVAARLGIPDDIFKQAVAGLYGQAA